MFLGSSSKVIATGLEQVAEQSEDERSRVIAVRACRYPVVRRQLELTISEPRRFNVLEEFVLRAGSQFVDPAPTEAELSVVLGLDRVFVSSTVRSLQTLGALEPTVDGTVRVTAEGRELYAKGAVPRAPRTEAIVAVGDGLLGRLDFEPAAASEASLDLPNLLDMALFDDPVPELEPDDLAAVRQALVAAGSGLHVPAEGRVVTAAIATGEPELGWRQVTLFAMHDLVEGDVKLQARVGPHLSVTVTEMLAARCAEEPALLGRLLGIEEDVLVRAQAAARAHVNAAVAERQTRYQALASLQVVGADASEAGPLDGRGTVRLLRDGEIRKVFLAAVAQAKQEIVLFSPWISEQVIDHDLSTRLAQASRRGVFTIIGYGIASSLDGEERPPAPAAIEALHSIRTPEGLPAVVLLWLGNSHAKELIVDRARHLSGSFNWLSYRGDYLPRGETVYEVTIPSEVDASRAYYEARFLARAEQNLAAGSATWNRGTITRSLATLVGLGFTARAYDHARRQGDSEQVLDWLGLMTQRYRAGANLPEDLALVEEALSGLAGMVEAGRALPRARVTMLLRLLGFIRLKEPQVPETFIDLLRGGLSTDLTSLGREELWGRACQEAGAGGIRTEAPPGAAKGGQA